MFHDSGLFNDALEQLATFRDQATLISGFLTSQPQPTCIIAHNGHHFDFPLLQAELCKAKHTIPVDAEIWCADSLEAFRVLDGLPATPEWITRKENEEKRRNTNINVLTPKVPTSETNSNNTTGLEKNDRSQGVAESPSDSKEVGEINSNSADMPTQKSALRRQADDVNSPAISKLAKLDPATDGSDSQDSVPDRQHVEACVCDAGLVQVTAGAVVVCTQQSYLETTPTKSPGVVSSSGSTGTSVAGQFVKKQQPPPVNPSDRDRVTRRLFDVQPSTPTTGALSQSAERLNASSEEAAAAAGEHSSPKGELFSQGSLSDEDLLRFVQQAESEAVTSLLLPTAGAGEPVRPLSLLCRTQEQAENQNGQSEELNAIDTVPTKLCSNRPQMSESVVSMHAPHTTQTYCPSSANTSGLCSPTASSGSWVSPPKLCSNRPETSGSGVSVPASPTTQTSPSARVMPRSSQQVSYKLSEIYRREFGRDANNAHTAEDDCASLLKIIVKKLPEFMRFVEQHAVTFDSVAAMF